MVARYAVVLGAPTDPNSVGVRISCVKALFAVCYGFEHFLTSTMQINPIKIILSNKIKL